MTTVPDHLIDKAARVFQRLMRLADFPPVWEDTPAHVQDVLREDASAILAAVADDLRAEGVRKAKAEALRSAAEMIEDMRDSAEVAEVAAYVPGEFGRQNVIDRFNAAMEDPGEWLRSLADSGGADAYREDRVDAWLAEAWDEGYQEGWGDRNIYGRAEPWPFVYDTANPYRQETD